MCYLMAPLSNSPRITYTCFRTAIFDDRLDPSPIKKSSKLWLKKGVPKSGLWILDALANAECIAGHPLPPVLNVNDVWNTSVSLMDIVACYQNTPVTLALGEFTEVNFKLQEKLHHHLKDTATLSYDCFRYDMAE